MTEARMNDIRSAYEAYRDQVKTKREGSTMKSQGQCDQQVQMTTPKRKGETAIKSRTYEDDEGEEPAMQEASPR